ncbi:iron dicitrate transport regulator FecR [Pseudoflavitalea sp. G-6-1-2]|uniref:FecR domain-containing protein n=1 Tax=Pseudoflavitalea sp. G-6-1-2 TaxID=2728841 RepID=UPI00146F4521|nr:FecR domain-containing protein [Pseudoflavitalea sp. G-6-1-2]NML20915.1 iron dicitrate transport regulator FecR [Pseudoflavitalea sp. G-6-1-2]
MNAGLYNMSDDLLVKYLLGEASASERKEVETWISADTDHYRYYENFKFIWDESQQLAARSTVNENDAWKRFQQRIAEAESDADADDEHGSPVMTVVKPERIRWYETRVAASIIMLLGVAGLLFYILVPFKSNHSGNAVVVATTTASKAETLSDGSIVTLNKNSAISFEKGFTDDKRVVSLKGEAFFQIQPDKSKPFIVTVNDVTITVLGTSFNVKSINGKTEVIVESGMVKVDRANQSVQLKQKEKLEIEKKDSVLEKVPVTDQLYKFYRTREFVCDATPLWKLVDAINSAYGVNIVLEKPSLKNATISGEYYDLPLDDLLDLIVNTYNEENIVIERKDSLIILK